MNHQLSSRQSVSVIPLLQIGRDGVSFRFADVLDRMGYWFAPDRVALNSIVTP